MTDGTHEFRTSIGGREVRLIHERVSQNRDIPGEIYALSAGDADERLATVTIEDFTSARAESEAIAAGIDWFRLPYEQIDECTRQTAQREGRFYQINGFEVALDGDESRGEAVDLFMTMVATNSPDDLFRRPGLGATSGQTRRAEYHLFAHDLDRAFRRSVVWEAGA